MHFFSEDNKLTDQQINLYQSYLSKTKKQKSKLKSNQIMTNKSKEMMTFESYLHQMFYSIQNRIIQDFPSLKNAVNRAYNVKTFIINIVSYQNVNKIEKTFQCNGESLINKSINMRYKYDDQNYKTSTNKSKNENLYKVSRNVRNVHMNDIKYLFKRKNDLKAKDVDVLTALRIAVRNGQLNILKYLADKNVNLENKDNNGQTPLHIAAFNGHFDIVKYLIERRVNFEIHDNDGLSPLHLATFNRHLDILRYLNETGINLETVDSIGNTPLHIAASKGHLDIVKYLVQNNVNLECTDNNGWTPIHLAAREGFLDIVRYLDDRKVNLEAVDNYGWTPIHFAAEKGHLETVRYMVNRNVKTYMLNDCGRTAMDLAIKNKFTEIVNILQRQSLSFEQTYYHVSKIDSLVRTYIDKSFICQLSCVNGTHVLSVPIALECSHVVCLKCIFDLIGQYIDYDAPCCLHCIDNLGVDDIFESESYKRYEMRIKEDLFYFSKSLLDTLREGAILMKHDEIIRSFEIQCEYFEEEIEIRYESLIGQINFLNKTITKRLRMIESGCKKYLKKVEKHKNCDKNYYYWENLYYIKNLRIHSKLPIRKDMGSIKVLPNYIPDHKISKNELKIQKSEFLIDLYVKLKEKKSNKIDKDYK